MNIGFFSDDASAIHAALLANVALNRDRRRDPGILAADGVPGPVADHLDQARKTDRHGLVALPLAALDSRAIRPRLDLAVVAAGHGPVSQAVARRTVASEARWPRPHVAPAWLLSGKGPRLEVPIRRLPVTMIPLRLDEAVQLRTGCSCGLLHHRAVGLAAALRIAVDDPHADGIDPAEIAELLVPDPRHATPGCPSPRLRQDLLDLADDLVAGPPIPIVSVQRRRGPAFARGHASRNRHRSVARTPDLPATRHDPDCAYAAGR